MIFLCVAGLNVSICEERIVLNRRCILFAMLPQRYCTIKADTFGARVPVAVL